MPRDKTASLLSVTCKRKRFSIKGFQERHTSTADSDLTSDEDEVQLKRRKCDVTTQLETDVGGKFVEQPICDHTSVSTEVSRVATCNVGQVQA